MKGKKCFKKIIQNILLSFTAMLMIIILSEGMLRFTPFRETLVTINLPRGYFKPDPECGYDITENFPYSDFSFRGGSHKIWSNALGCFDAPFQSGCDYAILVGDSFAWGWAPYAEKFGTIIEENCGIRILKCGVGGYGTKQEFLKLKKIVKNINYPPKLILVSYFLNDIENDYLFPEFNVVDRFLVQKVILKNMLTGEREAYSEEEIRKKMRYYEKYFVFIDSDVGLAKAWLRSHSILFNLAKGLPLLRKIFSKLNILEIKYCDFKPEESIWLKEAISGHLKNIENIIKYADSIGAKMMFIIIPEKYQVYEFLKSKLEKDRPTYENVYEKVIGLLKDRNISYIDLTPEFKKYADFSLKKNASPRINLYWESDPHWNSKGNRLAGLLISDYLLENSVVKADGLKDRLKKIKKELQALFN